MTNKELVLKFYDEVFNGWDVSHLDEYMKEDYIQHNPTAPTGRAGFLQFAEKFLAMKPHIPRALDFRRLNIFLPCSSGYLSSL